LTKPAETVDIPAQWSPTEQDLSEAMLADFARFVEARVGVQVPDYWSLWRWSVDDVALFWRTLWDYFDLGPVSGEALADPRMPGARWFTGTQLNYVDQVVRHNRSDRPAILSITEDGGVRKVSWQELLGRAATLAHTLRTLGVERGDCVAGYLPNIAEAVIAFLAAASIGAVWSACGQDYSAPAALDRLGQLNPKVLVTTDGYRFGGKEFHKLDEALAVRDGLESLHGTIIVSRLGGPVPDCLDWAQAAAPGDGELATTPLAFEHPLWVLFSSGTTGKPKGIVHGHGGVLIEHLKVVALQSDIGPSDTFFWYTSTSWMVWNFQIAGLLVGATIVCYDGSPTWPHADALWGLAADLSVTVFGTSPGYVLASAKAGLSPAHEHNLTALRFVGVTGSTLPPSSSLWLRDEVGGVRVASIAGGTDVVSGFIGGVRTVPVWPGELSVPYLGVAVDSWDDSGQPVRGDVGEMVITKPMPSMPVYFWNDPDGKRYRKAYFDMFPGVWRHGDWITITPRGSVVVSGRSDSTLNRHGVRMGSADIYQVVEQLLEIADSLVLGVERPDGGYWMPLFVVLREPGDVTDDLRDRIAAAIRSEASPRHVPDEIIAAPAIPRTRTGKKLEVPLKKLAQGADAAQILSRSAVDDPAALDWFSDFFASHRRA
jgi:acetoacetyl-CoA synthetase